jgi:hypothetical protein
MPPLFVTRFTARFHVGEYVDGDKRNDRYHYYGWTDTADADPQAFLVQMAVNKTSPAHFHGVEQFQVMFGAPGAWYQRTPVESMMVHYADAFTTYGPFGTQGEEMEFFTLRPRHNEITGVMPHDRAKLRGRGRGRGRGHRNIHSAVAPAEVEGNRRMGPGETRVEPVIPGDEDGLAVWLLRAGPNADLVPPDPKGSGGQYWCVVGGEVRVDGGTSVRQSLHWVAPGESSMSLTAGDAGFELLVLQFPMRQEAAELPS